MDQRPNCKNYETLIRKHRHKSWWPWIRQWLFRYDTHRKSNNNKKEKLDFTNSKKKILLWRTSLRAKATLREKKKWSWRNHGPWLQSILQRFSNQNSMVLTPKQKYRSMKLDEKSRDKSKHLSMTPNLCQRRQEYKMEKIPSLQ